MKLHLRFLILCLILIGAGVKVQGRVKKQVLTDIIITQGLIVLRTGETVETVLSEMG